MVSSLPGSSVHGVSQAKILEWAAISFSRESSPARDQTYISCLAGGFFTTWEAPGGCKHTNILPSILPLCLNVKLKYLCLTQGYFSFWCCPTLNDHISSPVLAKLGDILQDLWPFTLLPHLLPLSVLLKKKLASRPQWDGTLGHYFIILLDAWLSEKSCCLPQHVSQLLASHAASRWSLDSVTNSHPRLFQLQTLCPFLHVKPTLNFTLIVGLFLSSPLSE